MTGITADVLAKLQAPFKVDEHEFRDGGKDGKLVYITEEPLIDRLTEIDPNWQFHILSTIITDYHLTRPDCAIVSAELTLCGITRGGVGNNFANIKRGEWDKKLNKWVEYETPIIYPLSETEVKGAATDALKRCARQFGVGGYLLRLKDVRINSEDDFARWYAREFGGQVAQKRSPQPSPRHDPPARGASTPATPPDAPDSELDAVLNGPEPDTRARELARETFPFSDSDKYTRWQDYITQTDNWNIPFWATAKKTLNLTEDDVHHALDVASVTDWGGERGNVARLWLTLCEKRIALDDIAAQADR